MRMVAAILFLLVAALIGLVEFLAVIDPAAAKMADDGDPFGDPNVSWTQFAGWMVAMLACVSAAVLLLRSGKKG